MLHPPPTTPLTLHDDGREHRRHVAKEPQAQRAADLARRGRRDLGGGAARGGGRLGVERPAQLAGKARGAGAAAIAAAAAAITRLLLPLHAAAAVRLGGVSVGVGGRRVEALEEEALAARLRRRALPRGEVRTVGLELLAHRRDLLLERAELVHRGRLWLVVVVVVVV